MGWLKWVAGFVVVMIAVLVWYFWPKPPAVTTALEIEAYGGFAYIQPPGQDEVSIAFLKDADVSETDAAGNTVKVCDVDQLGVDLMVVSGNIIQPSPAPANRKFDLAKAVVTFPDLANSAKALAARG